MKKEASKLSKALLTHGPESTSTKYSSALSSAMCYSKLISQILRNKTWNKLERNCLKLFIFPLSSSRYYVEFSKPDKLRPIPEGTVKVFFDLTMGESADDYDIEFNFENESLKHRMDSTMREDMFQVSCL